MLRRISDEEVRRAAALAKLTLTDSEIAEARGSMQDMLEAIDALKSAEIEVGDGPLPQYTRSPCMREDVTIPPAATEDVAAMHAVIERAARLPAPRWAQSLWPPPHSNDGRPDSEDQNLIPDGRDA
jgi:Asp-tRNA(Asn)/Glu-tRNA(Gln) amidotransferase C subunit